MPVPMRLLASLVAGTALAGCGGDADPPDESEGPAAASREFVERVADADPSACELMTPHGAFQAKTYGRAASCEEAVQQQSGMLEIGFAGDEGPGLTAELDAGRVGQHDGHLNFEFCTANDTSIGLTLFYAASGWQVDSFGASQVTVGGDGEEEVQPCHVRVSDEGATTSADTTASEEPTPPPESPEEEALAAVADYLDAAILYKDGADACAALTEAAQLQLAEAIADARQGTSSADCVAAYETLFPAEQRGPPSSIAKADWFGDEFRAGTFAGKPIEVTIEGSHGEVGWIPADPKSIIPVEEVDGKWLVANGTEPLFSYGVDPVRD
jgi:hypothetical protein